MKIALVSPLVLAPVLAFLLHPARAEVGDAYQRCLVEALQHADADTPVGVIRKKCAATVTAPSRKAQVAEGGEAEGHALSHRMAAESHTEEQAFVITPYLPNYILLAAYNSAGVNEKPFREQFPDEDFSLDDVEAKFQISFKFPVVKNLFGDNGDLYAAYTNRSFWQVYNGEESAPFRETNHQPEAWLRFYTGWSILGLRNVANDLGIIHQSNGRGGVLSRSWNRIYLRMLFEHENLAFSIMPWYRIPEDKADDDNPDIDDYLGHFEFQGAYRWRGHVFGLMFRNNLDFDRNRGAAQLDWSFPLYGHLKGYVQWFNGYGESLIDYDRNVNSIGVGIKLTDWL